jgi:signal transduction histidine kinase
MAVSFRTSQNIGIGMMLGIIILISLFSYRQMSETTDKLKKIIRIDERKPASSESIGFPAETITDHVSDDLREHNFEIIKIMDLSKNILAGILLAAVIIAFFISTRMNRALAKPVNRLLSVVNTVAKGDFYQSIEVVSKDNIGQLSIALNQMIADLKEQRRQLKQAKDIAEKANLAKSDFLANMSHELRTPLNHIIGFSDIILDKSFGELNETQEEFLNDVLTSSHHLLTLINDILDLSKIESGKMELAVSEVAIQSLLDNSLTMIREKAIKHGLHIEMDITSLPQTIFADGQKLKQVLYNLLSNASKFTPEGGKIELSAMLVNSEVLEDKFHKTQNINILPNLDWIVISVKDSGIGLKHDDLERVFSPFEQVDSSRNRKFQGTGLGLSISKQMVEIHGGHIWVESIGIGRGATFTFGVPVEIGREAVPSDIIGII